MDAQDVDDLRRLLQSATRPRVVALLQSAIDGAATSQQAPVVATSSVDAAPAPSLAATPVAAAPASFAPVPVAPATAAAVAAAQQPTSRTYTSLTSYGFSADGADVEVIVMDLPGVGALPRESVTCEFGPQSFDLRVHGLGGRDYRLRVPALDKEIQPAASRVVVGKNRVTVKLRKKEAWDYWTELASKKGPAGAKKAAADPMGGIMDVMRDMYADGTPETKKMIAEAWTQSRQQQGAAGGGGFGGGLGGGFGGDSDLSDV